MWAKPPGKPPMLPMGSPGLAHRYLTKKVWHAVKPGKKIVHHIPKSSDEDVGGRAGLCLTIKFLPRSWYKSRVSSCEYLTRRRGFQVKYLSIELWFGQFFYTIGKLQNTLPPSKTQFDFPNESLLRSVSCELCNNKKQAAMDGDYFQEER